MLEYIAKELWNELFELKTLRSRFLENPTSGAASNGLVTIVTSDQILDADEEAYQ